MTALPNLLSDDVAVVTGAAQGNGLAIAAGLARSGATVVLCDMNAELVLDQAARLCELGLKAHGAQLDVTQSEACRDFAAWCKNTVGTVSILVNNAGITRRTAPDEAEFLTHLAQQLDEFGWYCQYGRGVFGSSQETRGRIVNLGSIASFVAYQNSASYAASKGGVIQLTKALACDLAAYGIRVNGIAPGVIATPMTEGTCANPDAMQRFMSHTPMGRVGDAEELVGPVLFLASDLSSYVTGTMLPVDGGYLTN